MTISMSLIPACWNQSRLRFVATINPSKTEVASLAPETEVSFVPMEAVGEDASLDPSRLKPISEVSTGYTYFRDGDILIAKITPCFENGKATLARGLAKGVGFGSTEFHVIRPSPRLETRFAFYVIRSSAFRDFGTASMYGAGGQKRVPTDFIADFPIAYPPLPEQRAIADFLDRETAKIDALIAKQEELAAGLRERREALFSSLAENEAPTARLRFLANILPGYAFASDTFRSEGDGVRLLRGINLRPGFLDWDDPALLDNEAGHYARFALKIDDIVVGMDRPWISTGVRVSRIVEADLPCLLVQRVARVRCGHELHPRFVEFALRTRKFLAHFEPDMTGVSVPHISDTQIGDFRIPVPPYREQQHLVEMVQGEDNEITLSLAKLDQFGGELRERRMALITAAVSGQIGVRAAPAKVASVASNDNQKVVRVVVGAEIVARHGAAKNFGRVKFQKLLYLAEVHTGISELGGNYVREAAGPLARDLLSETEHGMAVGGFYKAVAPVSENDGVAYERIGTVGAHRDQLTALLGERAAPLTKLIDLLKDYSTRDVEAITTLYAVWNDALLDGESPDDARIIRGFLDEWHPEKRVKFKAADLPVWLGWMRRNGVVPSGSGAHTYTDQLFV
jgi:type I restriction enzyme S subunit